MENKEIQKLLIQYNSLYKEIDDIYHSLARHYGLSDCALWILYTVIDIEEDYTQNKICEQLSLSKQTVNSALKKLEKDGYIKLELAPGNQKNKLVRLTKQGNIFANKAIGSVMTMEQNAFCHLTEEERTIFLNLYEKYVAKLQLECNQLLKE